MKIEITDSKVVLDGVTYRKEETLPSEPKFEIGKWYTNTHLNETFRVGDIQGDVIYMDCTDSCKPYNFISNYEYGMACRLATPSEIEAHLIKEADKRGLKVGVKIITVMGTSIYISKGNYWYNPEHDALYTLDGMTLYDSGEWATIIPDKKPLPKTREEFEKYNTEWSEFWLKAPTGSKHKDDVARFLDQYDFND